MPRRSARTPQPIRDRFISFDDEGDLIGIMLGKIITSENIQM